MGILIIRRNKNHPNYFGKMVSITSVLILLVSLGSLSCSSGMDTKDNGGIETKKKNKTKLWNHVQVAEAYTRGYELAINYMKSKWGYWSKQVGPGNKSTRFFSPSERIPSIKTI